MAESCHQFSCADLDRSEIFRAQKHLRNGSVTASLPFMHCHVQAWIQQQLPDSLDDLLHVCEVCKQSQWLLGCVFDTPSC